MERGWAGWAEIARAAGYAVEEVFMSYASPPGQIAVWTDPVLTESTLSGVMDD